MFSTGLVFSPACFLLKKTCFPGKHWKMDSHSLLHTDSLTYSRLQQWDKTWYILFKCGNLKKDVSFCSSFTDGARSGRWCTLSSQCVKILVLVKDQVAWNEISVTQTSKNTWCQVGVKLMSRKNEATVWKTSDMLKQ